MNIGEKVKLVEVGARDGLQNEKTPVSVDIKLNLLKQLIEAGHRCVEPGSFVHPKWVPQMASSDEVYQQLSRWLDGEGSPSQQRWSQQHERNNQVALPMLAPNVKGMERAIALGVSEVACFTAASNTFNQKNIACDIEQSFNNITDIIALAKQHQIRVRGYLSCVVACPYEGKTDAGVVKELTERLLTLGCYEVSLGDTIGVGTAGEIRKLLGHVLAGVNADKLALHFHDTYGQALANILVGLELGIRTFDSSIAGLGGCPYAPGASGNVATEDLVYLLHGSGFETGLDLERLVIAGRYISDQLQRPTGSKVAQAMSGQCRN